MLTTKLQSDQYFYRHVRGLHIINLHIRNTNSNFPMKCMDFGNLSVDCRALNLKAKTKMMHEDENVDLEGAIRSRRDQNTGA